MYFNVTEAHYLEGYKLQLLFEDGSRGSADLSSYADPTNVFKAFLDLSFFKNFKIEYGTLVWGDGEVDIAPETLYSLATGKPITYTALQTNV